VYEFIADVSRSRALAALTLSLIASGLVFVIVWKMVQLRYPLKRPVVGAMRGAAVGVCVLILVTTGNAALHAGSGGVLYSIFGQLFYMLLAFGWFAAAVGGLGGKYIEHSIFSSNRSSLTP
jgi:hypothetical protein